METETPPTVDTSGSDGLIKENINLFVPTSTAVDAYGAKEYWENFPNILIDSGMRMKVTMKNGMVYEFKTQNLQGVEFYRVN